MSAGISGALVPHAPLLLPQVVGDQVARETQELRGALGSLSFGDAELVVLLSPHAQRTCVYRTIAGSLDDFGLRGIGVERATNDDAVAALAARWEVPVEPAPVDHGVLVPLLMLSTDTIPVVAAGLAEITDGAPVGDAITAGAAFAGAVRELATDKSIAVVVSAHTASALTPRAPLTERAEAKEIEAAVMLALQDDPGAALSSLEALSTSGGSCSPGTLAAYAELFSGRRSEVIAYAYPFGVGYVVARVAP